VFGADAAPLGPVPAERHIESNVTTTLSILAPIFGLLAIGFAAARLRLIGPEAVAGLVKVVSVIEIPALLFRALARERATSLPESTSQRCISPPAWCCSWRPT
jgi:predicted permease